MLERLRDKFLTFVTYHPRVITLLAGLGITISFSFIGRLSLDDAHLAFAAPQGPPGETFPGTPGENFPVDKVPKETLSSVRLASCEGCDVPPGEIIKDIPKGPK